jgi:hypothetical protein
MSTVLVAGAQWSVAGYNEVIGDYDKLVDKVSAAGKRLSSRETSIVSLKE